MAITEDRLVSGPLSTPLNTRANGGGGSWHQRQWQNSVQDKVKCFSFLLSGITWWIALAHTL